VLKYYLFRLVRVKKRSRNGILAIPSGCQTIFAFIIPPYDYSLCRSNAGALHHPGSGGPVGKFFLAGHLTRDGRRAFYGTGLRPLRHLGPSAVMNLGLLLFVYAVGLQAGPRFFRLFRKQGLRYVIIGVAVALIGALAT